MKGQSQPPLAFLLPLLVFPPEEQFLGCVLRIPRVLQKNLPEPTHLQTQQPCLCILHVGFHLKFHFEKRFYCSNMEVHCSRFAQVWSNCYNKGQPLMKGENMILVWYQHYCRWGAEGPSQKCRFSGPWQSLKSQNLWGWLLSQVTFMCIHVLE